MGLILHAYNLHKGLRCTGFDEDDAVPEGEEAIVNLPADFLEKSREIMSLRYVNADQ